MIVQRQVTKGGQTSYEEECGHPFRQLIMHPIPLMTEGDLMQAAIVSWDISIRAGSMPKKSIRPAELIELWPLNPACMTPRYRQTANRAIVGYRWESGQQRKDYTLDDLVIRAAPSWYDPPPLAAALGSVSADSASRYDPVILSEWRHSADLLEIQHAAERYHARRNTTEMARDLWRRRRVG